MNEHFVNRILKLNFSNKYIILELFIALMSAALLIPIIPSGSGSTFSQASYITELTLPAVALIYSRIDYAGTFYIPWIYGAESFTVGYVGPAYIAAIGSGFFVNPNGYLVTNGHIIFCFESKNFKEDLILNNWIIQDAVSRIVEYISQTRGISFNENELAIILNYNLENGKIRQMSRSVFCILGEASGEVIEAKRGISATVVNSDPFLGRDLAILKVELSNTPSILIGDSDKVKVGDVVYAFGYPGVVTFHPMLSPGTLLSPSVTQGVVSAKRLTAKDIAAIQHSASITHGNSGGPLVNEKGEVIGVNNMGSIGELGLQVAGFNFAITSNVLKDFLRENGVENTIGDVTRQYEKGLAFYYAKMYASAKKQFDAVNTLFPYHWRSKQLSPECQSAISRGDKAGSSLSLSVVPSTVRVKKERITVNGSLRHESEMPIPIVISWPATQITLEYMRPDRSILTRKVLNSKDGKFSDSFIPDLPGQWLVRASWDGDEDHVGTSSQILAFTVTEPTLIEILMETGLIYAIPITIALIAALVLIRKRKALPPPPPSP